MIGCIVFSEVVMIIYQQINRDIPLIQGIDRAGFEA